MDDMVTARAATGQATLALGTVQWGQPYGVANHSGQPSVQEIRSLLATARQAGLHILDTARRYGTAEARIGRILGDDPYWTVVTKLSNEVWKPGQSWRRTLALTEESVSRSLKNLRQERLKALLLHQPLHRTVVEGKIWKRLLRYRDQGRIASLGVSVLCPRQAWDLLDDPDVADIQVPTSLLDRRLWSAGFFERASATGKQVFVRSIFLQGLAFLQPEEITGHLAPLQPALHRILEWSNQRKVPAAVAFLGFARSLPGVRILLGCETEKQLRNNLNMWRAAQDLALEVGELATSLPAVPDDVLDPSQWKGAPRPAGISQP